MWRRQQNEAPLVAAVGAALGYAGDSERGIALGPRMPSKDELVALLCRVPLFSDLDESERAVLTSLMRPLVFKAGDILFRQGAPADGLYVIAEGRVAILVRIPGDDEVALTTLGPDEVLGDMALVDRKSRSASARAVTGTRAWFLDGRWFDAQRAQLEPSSFKMLRRLALLLCSRLRQTTQDMVEVLPPGGVSATEHGEAPPLTNTRPAGTREGPLLRFLPIFREFSDVELMTLARRTHRQDLPRGRVVFTEGEPGASVFIIVWGAVEVSVQRGEKQRLSILGPGKMFGHVALLDGGRRSATCKIRENAVLLRLDKVEIDRFFEEGGPIAFKLMDLLLHTLIGAQRDADAALARLIALEQLKERSSVQSERG